MTPKHLAWIAADDPAARLSAWRVHCSCGWISIPMGQGDAWTTKEHVLTDMGHRDYNAEVEQSPAKRRALEQQRDPRV